VVHVSAASNMPAARGRQFFFNPGPTNIPDRILGAMNRATVDFMAEDFLAVFRRVHAGVMRVLRTKQNLLFYAANGHGAWEAAFVNCFQPGDRLLLIDTGHFAMHWGMMATDLGYTVETLTADWRRGVTPEQIAARLRADSKGEIKGVMVVHNETATGVVQPLADIRKAMDAAKHPALLLVDTISSLGSIDVRMDDWGLDLVVGGSQKGLMMVTGLSFTGISHKALAKSETITTPRSYFNWKGMRTMQPQRFPGTTPVHLFFGMDEAIQMLEEEGLDAALTRHRRLAGAVRAAVAHWGQNARSGASIGLQGISGTVKGIELLPAEATRFSDSVSAIMMPDGHDANAMRKIAIDRYNLSLGGGLGPLAGRVIRIGHLGDLNEPMVLGALATTELAMRAAGVPHRGGGVEAAIGALG
jgi:alanine-glyoxylate transaminase / serine-glyoxylate transaminase / serine-pyruvate transaminase